MKFQIDKPNKNTLIRAILIGIPLCLALFGLVSKVSEVKSLQTEIASKNKEIASANAALVTAKNDASKSSETISTLTDSNKDLKAKLDAFSLQVTKCPVAKKTLK